MNDEIEVPILLLEIVLQKLYHLSNVVDENNQCNFEDVSSLSEMIKELSSVEDDRQRAL